MDVIDDYNERTAQYIADKISSESYSTEELMAIKNYEAENKGRVTVTTAVDRVLAMRDDGPEPELVKAEDEGDLITTQDEAVTRSQHSNMANDTTADDRPNDGDGGESIDEVNAQPAIEGNDRDPDTVRVALASARSGYAAGHLFEDANEVKEVPYNRRVELALERGELRYA